MVATAKGRQMSLEDRLDMLRMIGAHDDVEFLEKILGNMSADKGVELYERTYVPSEEEVRDGAEREASERVAEEAMRERANDRYQVQNYVKGVRGGMAALPVDRQHKMKQRKNPKCGYVGKCKHVPRCEPVWGFACEKDELTGFCTCDLPDVDKHVDANEGVRVKGITPARPANVRPIKADRSFKGLTLNTEALRKQIIPGERPYAERLTRRQRTASPERTRLAGIMRRVMRSPKSEQRDEVMAELRAEWMDKGPSL